MFDAPREDPLGPAPVAAPPLTSERLGTPVEVGRLVVSLRRAGRAMLLAAAFSSLCGVIAARTVVPRQYASVTTLTLDRRYTGEGAARHTKTLVETVKLPHILELARERTQVAASVERLGRAISVESPSDTNLIAIRVDWNDPDVARRLADAVAAAFLESRLEAERGRIAEDLRRMEEEVKGGRERVKEAHTRYDAWRARAGVADPSGEAQAALVRVERLRAEAEAADATAHAERSRYELLVSASSREPSLVVASENQLDAAAQKLAEIEAQLKAEAGRLTRDHPRVLALEAQASALRAERGVSTVTGRTVAPNPRLETIKQALTGSAAERAAAETKRHRLSGQVEDARREAGKAVALQAQALELQRTLRDAETRLGESEARRLRLLDEASAPAGDVVVTAPATSPLRPTKPTGRLVAAASPLAGIVVVALVTLLRALGRLRVVTARECAFWGQRPVLGTALAGDASSLEELARSTARVARRSGGSVVLVAVNGHAAAAARELASQLETHGSHGETVVVAASDGAALRRKARAAALVVVVASSGRVDALELARVSRLVADAPMACSVVVDLGAGLAELTDRVGEPPAPVSTTPREEQAA